MKQPLTFLVFWLVAGLCANAVDPAVRGTTKGSIAVELNGIISLPGVNRAFFILYPPTSEPRSFTLAEGESRFGIKLLAVNAVSGCVQIENCGWKQALHIGSTPGLAPASVAVADDYPPGSAAHGGNGFAGNSGSNSSIGGGATATGNPTGSGLTGNGSSSNPNQNSASGQNSVVNSNSNGADPATALKDQANTEWYQESAGIEQSRRETVQQVLAGDMTPWPRTPLTPPGTPSQLVDNETLFANHMPGFYQQ